MTGRGKHCYKGSFKGSLVIDVGNFYRKKYTFAEGRHLKNTSVEFSN
jgi:hypothetical protein